MDKDSKTSAANDWNALQYLKFERERTQPSRDLAARIELEAPSRILDLGCGPGNSTQVLRERFPSADILGIDSSPDMIRRARKQYPELTFDSVSLTPDCGEIVGMYDVIFSNANVVEGTIDDYSLNSLIYGVRGVRPTSPLPLV